MGTIYRTIVCNGPILTKILLNIAYSLTVSPPQTLIRSNFETVCSNFENIK